MGAIYIFAYKICQIVDKSENSKLITSVDNNSRQQINANAFRLVSTAMVITISITIASSNEMCNKTVF